MCVVVLTYVAPLDAIDAQMKEHVAWLAKGYAEGVFLASGRQIPRTGGVILIRGEKAAVEAVVATDPFVSGGLATPEITAFTASMVLPGIAELLA
nr:YciI family protein [Sphingomonas sp. H160509]